MGGTVGEDGVQLMRAWVYNRIKAVPGLPAGVETRVISSGSNAKPTPPFIVVNMGIEQPRLDLVGQRADGVLRDLVGDLGGHQLAHRRLGG